MIFGYLVMFMKDQGGWFWGLILAGFLSVFCGLFFQKSFSLNEITDAEFCVSLFVFLNFLMLLIFERQRQSMSGGGAERKGDTDSKAGSRL